LAQALSILPEIKDNNLLVGINTADDAGIYRLSDNTAVALTVDLLTPVVEDPYTYGMIAAANSISDIYAMGGTPKIALNVIGFPGSGDPETLGMILKGGQEKSKEAGVLVIGGHTFDTPEVKYGLAVIGYIHPKKIITNAGAKPGDLILLTKPIGKGTIIQSTLVEKKDEKILKPVIKSMITLNRDACLAMKQTDAHAATDITGYGLMGHLVELAEASRIGIELQASKIPVHKGALELLKNGLKEPGIAMNLGSFQKKVDVENIDPDFGKLVFGSETSGGLAIALPEDKVKIFQEKYAQEFWIIGRITTENPNRVKIIP
jgi:selenide,water dikinase